MTFRARWKTRGRVPGVRGLGARNPEVRGIGVRGHGVWKTRGLSGAIISPNNETEILLFQIAMKINRRETRFLVIKAP